MNPNFQNRVAIVTGASSGIGEETAKSLLKLGASVVVTGRNEQKLKELTGDAGESEQRVFIISGDITEADFRKRLIDETQKKFGRIDILINAAGIIGSGTVETTELADFDYMMDINLRSVFHLVQLAVPHIKKTKGNIVNVGSVTGTRAFPGILSYCVSKAGLDQLTRVLALELAESGVRVNGVNPGVVKTNLHKNGGMDKETYEKFLAHSRSTHPLGRVGKPEEIADLIAFLASDASAWTTGVTFNIDGGRHLTCAR